MSSPVMIQCFDYTETLVFEIVRNDLKNKVKFKRTHLYQ